MSYKLKTLIVFDTNSLRSTDTGEMVYSSFSFGKAYDVINDYIEVNRLQEDVIISVSALVIDEIKIQMERSYKSDIQKLTDTKRRMSGLPHVTTELIGIPDNAFDCSDYVELKAKEYLAKNKHVRLLTFSDAQSEQILKSLITRAHKTKPPFFKTTRNSDAGFKDGVIWETLLNYQDIEHFNKVILVTKDEGFKGCEAEFATRWNKHFKIISTPEAVNTELGIDYENYIKERAIHDFSQTDYFRDYLNDILKEKSLILIDEIEEPIRSFTIDNPCQYVSRILRKDEDLVNLLISSKITIAYKWDDQTKEQEVEALTLLEDDETREIISTEFDIELK